MKLINLLLRIENIFRDKQDSKGLDEDKVQDWQSSGQVVTSFNVVAGGPWLIGLSEGGRI